MKEREINEKRHWKAEVFPYDVFIPDNSQECNYCLTYNQATLLRGLLEPVGWSTRWWSDTTDVSKDSIEEFRDDLIRRLMMSCCGDEGLLFQYDSDGNLEVSEDGGTTYDPAPQDDIRINPRVTYPPIPSGDDVNQKCKAADGAVTLIKEQIGDQLTDDMSRYTLQQLIHDWTVTVIGTSNPFEGLLIVVSNQIFALLISAIRAALDSGVYDTLRCILYCHMDSTGFFNGAAWEAVRSDILSQITGIAGVFLEHLVYLIGNGGLSNLARAGAGSDSADCSACCPTCGSDWVGGYNFSGSLSPHAYTSGTDIDGNFFITIDSWDRGDGQHEVAITAPVGATMDCCHVTWATDPSDYTLSNKADVACGSEPTYENYVFHPTASASDGNTVLLLGQIGSPFTVTFTFTTL